MQHKLGNGGVFALSTFGFALALFGFQMVVTPPVAVGATLNAMLIAGVMEVLGGFFLVVTGEGYLAGVVITFGALLVGFYLLLTGHPNPHLMTPKAMGAYELWWIAPVAYMWVPALRRMGSAPRQFVPLSAGFLTLIAMLLTNGLGAYLGHPGLETASGWFAFVSAVIIWYVGYELSEGDAPALDGRRLLRSHQAEVGQAPRAAQVPPVVQGPPLVQGT